MTAIAEREERVLTPEEDRKLSLQRAVYRRSAAIARDIGAAPEGENADALAIYRAVCSVIRERYGEDWA